MFEIVEVGTGLIIGTIEEGDRIVKRKSVELLKTTTEVPNCEQFVKLYRDTMIKLSDEKLTAAEFNIFLHLVVHLRYKSNVAAYSNGRFLNRENISKDLNLSEITVKRSITNMVRYGMIVECNTTQGKCFVVNPFLCNVGDRINNTVIDLFKKSKWYREWKR